MALDHGDLFFVNRSAATYKIEALELGEYLTNNALPNGTYFVNNGMLSITNTGNPLLTTPIGIHSANSAANTILDFDDNFIVTRSGSDAAVTLNYPTVMEGLLCTDQNGNTPGFDESNCGCISLDFGYIANRLPCPNYGIVDNNGCLEINKCSDGVLGLHGTNEACLDVNICDGGGIVNDGGCIGLDYSVILDNIICDVDSSGLLHDGKCMTVNFPKVMAEMGLGKIRADDSIIIRDANNDITNDGDLTEGDVTLSVNPAMYEAPPINDIVAEGSDCLQINGNANLTQKEVKINLDEQCLITLINKHSGGGTGGGGVTQIKAGANVSISPSSGVGVVTVSSTGGAGGSINVCPDGGLSLAGGCLSINQAEDNTFCPSWYSNVVGSNMYVRASGSSSGPAIILGIEKAASGDEIDGRNGKIRIPWIGLFSNQSNGSFTVMRGIKGWKNIDDPCGGEPKQSDKNEAVFSVAKGTKVLPHMKTTGLINSANKNNGVVVCWNDKDDDQDEPTLNSGPPEGDGNINRMGFDITNFDIEQISGMRREDFPELDINVDTLVAAFEGFADDPQTPLGIARWGEKKVGAGDLGYPFLFVDTDELAERAPLLVNWNLKNTVYERVYHTDDEGNQLTDYDWQLPDRELCQDDLAPGSLNTTGLHILAMLGLKKAKSRIDELETQLATLEARLTAAGIP